MTKTAKVLLCIMFAIPISLLIYRGYQDVAYPITCMKHAKVEKIISVNYRHATILLSNGEEVTLNQPTVKPGDTRCVNWGREGK